MRLEDNGIELIADPNGGGHRIDWRGPQRGIAARPAYAQAGPGTP